MANHNGINGRKSRNLVGAGFLLVIAHVGATACGPEFDSCEDRHTCKPTGGSAGMSGNGNTSGSGGTAGASANPNAGATSGGASNGGAAGDANTGEGGASGNPDHTSNGGTTPGTSGAAGESTEEGGRSQAGTGGVDRGGAPASGGATGSGGTTGGSHATGGANATGGIIGVGGEGGDDAGGAPATDCNAGDTVPCTQLFGAGTACSGRTVACVNGRWPTTCIAGARDCTSAEDNDCDGKPDNTADATCVCASGKSQSCDPTPSNASECETGVALCVLRAGNTSSYWGTCKSRTDAAPTYTLNRIWCPDNTLLDAACTKTSGTAGTMQPKCIEYPNTCGFLYCM